MNLKSLLSSGFYTVNFLFGLSGPNRIWYAPEEFVRLHPYLSLLVYAPVVISFLYVPFIGRRWLKSENLVSILLITILFYFMGTFVLSKNYLLLSGSLIFQGINFSLAPFYSIYSFTIITSISLAISVGILGSSFNRTVLQGNRIISSIHDKRAGILRIENWNRTKEKDKTPSRRQSRSEIRLNVRLPPELKGIRLVSLFVIALVLLLFILPIYSNPLEYWEYNNNKPISGAFQVNNDFMDVGNFLSAASPYGNVLYLPVTVSPNAASQGNSSFMIASTPFSSFFDGQMINQDPGPSNMTFAYPIMKYFPGNSTVNISNFLSLLGVDYIVVNTAETPTWVSAPQNEFNGGGPPWNFPLFLRTLNESKDIKFVTSFGPYFIYKVENALPAIYATNAIP